MKCTVVGGAQTQMNEQTESTDGRDVLCAIVLSLQASQSQLRQRQ